MRAALALPAVVAFAAVSAAVVLLPEPAAPAAAGPTHLVYRQGTYAVRLLDEPCAYPDLAPDLENEGIPPARAMVVTSGTRTYGGCWVKDISGDILSMDLAGNGGTLPKEGFKPEPQG